MEPFTKIIHPVTKGINPTFCKIEFDGRRLSISGVEEPMTNGNCHGGCGQIVDSMIEADGNRRVKLAPDWTPALLDRFRAIWGRWHLNDMRPGCEHQREWPTATMLEVVSYTLTTEAQRLRDEVREAAADAALAGRAFNPTAQERALAELTTWYESIYQLPPEGSALVGCYKVRERVRRVAGTVYPHEHPEGLLTKPCPVCGYKYGSAWLFEAVPEDVLQFLADLPETDLEPAWV